MSHSIVLKTALAVCVVGAACASSPTEPEAPAETCSGYAPWSSSLYVLPYPAGTSYRVEQANCSPPGNGHRGTERYGYDFDMPLRTPLIAARAGVVRHVVASHADGEVGPTGLDTFIVIAHDDGSHALYGHITLGGALVKTGDTVSQGESIGLSGNTGNTNNFPHLHFSVHGCDPVTGGSSGCASTAVTFRNTTENPKGLQLGRSYIALPF